MGGEVKSNKTILVLLRWSYPLSNSSIPKRTGGRRVRLGRPSSLTSSPLPSSIVSADPKISMPSSFGGASVSSSPLTSISPRRRSLLCCSFAESFPPLGAVPLGYRISSDAAESGEEQVFLSAVSRFGLQWPTKGLRLALWARRKIRLIGKVSGVCWS